MTRFYSLWTCNGPKLFPLFLLDKQDRIFCLFFLRHSAPKIFFLPSAVTMTTATALNRSTMTVCLSSHICTITHYALTLWEKTHIFGCRWRKKKKWRHTEITHAVWLQYLSIMVDIGRSEGWRIKDKFRNNYFLSKNTIGDCFFELLTTC